jgi:hypothetical protein
MTPERRNIGTRDDYARQQRRKHFSATTSQHVTIEELSEDQNSMQPASRLHSEDKREKLISRRSESAVSSRELQVSSCSSWLAERNLHC